MTFIIFTIGSRLGYFWGLDSLDEGYAAEDLHLIFDAEHLCVGVEPWPSFLNSCTIHSKHTNLNSPADVELLYPELFI